MILINSSPKDTMKIFRPFSRYNVPVGIGCLITVLEREGIKAEFTDEQTDEDNTFDVAAEYAGKTEPPYIFGFSVVTAAFKSAVMTSKQLKALYPDSVILFGGIHPTAAPEEVLSHQHIDIVFRGEAEQILPELYQCLKKRRDFTHLENLSYRQNNQIIHNKRSSAVVDMDSLPPFPYHLFTSKKYDLGAIVSSRGCPHDCIFCSNRITTGKRYRYRSADAIADEINMLFHKYGKRHILILDDNFLVSKKRVYEVLDKIRKKGLYGKMNFTFQARGDNVEFRLLKDLYDAGFKNISIGMETASERLMKILNKGETVEQCIKAVRMAKEIGFHISATFMYGLPTETHEDRMNCLKLSREFKLDLVRFNNATPYPGTVLNEIAKKENRLHIKGLYENFNSVSAIIENPFRKIPFSYVPLGNSEEEIRNDIIFSFLCFYLNTDRIKMLFSKSDASKRWFNPGNRIKEMLQKIPALLFLGSILSVKFGLLFFNVIMKRKTSISGTEFIELLTGISKNSQKVGN